VKDAKYKRALNSMRRPDARLIKQHVNGKTLHYITPDIYIDNEIAERIKAHTLVRGGKDGLFPDTNRLGG
jgi:hypothetical protein